MANINWLSNPQDRNFFNASNWSPGTVPGTGDTAWFGASSTTTLTLTGGTYYFNLLFLAGAPSYSFTLTDPNALFIFYGDIIDGGARGVPSTDTFSATNHTTVHFDGAFQQTSDYFDLTTDSTRTIVYGITGGTGHVNAGGFSTGIITTNGTFYFDGHTDPGAATQLITNAGGVVYFSTSGVSGNHVLSAASIAGAGTYALGSNQLVIGDTFLPGGYITEVSGSIEGSGASLVFSGQTNNGNNGTLLLSGSNSYTDGTTINGGMLQLGKGGTSGSISGSVADNGTFAIDRSDTYAFGGNISGSGGFLQIRTGTTILTATDSVATTISAGALQLGNGGSPATGDALTINAGAVDLHGHHQSLGDLSGTGGTLTLGGGVLTLGTADSTSCAGAITGPGLVVKAGTGTLTLAGANAYTGGTVVEDGTLQLGDGGTSGSLTGAVLDDGVLAVDRSDVVTIANSIVSSGAFAQIGTGTTILGGANSYSGGTTISAGTLELGNASAAGTGAITFVNDPTLKIDGTTMPTNTLDGFALGDTIDLTSISNVAGSHADMDYATKVLTITEGSNSYTLQFDPTANFAGDYFHLTPDAGSGTLINEDSVACYCTGTLILGGHGEMRVEDLKIGDEVMTISGAVRPIKWIGRRSYSGRFIMGRKDILPVCFKAGALADNVPRRDLWISPHHAMFVEGVLVEARHLVNGVSVVQADHVGKVEYFHIELDSHDVIVAEGALSESFIDDDSRGMFHNAHEYYTLYTDEIRRPARYCAPRLDDGYEVEAVRRAIAQRAGLLRASDGPRTGELRGYIDLVGETCIAGWAQNADYPEAPVCLDIYAGGRLIGQTLANRYRGDLAQAKLGSGCHTFPSPPPPRLDFARDRVEVRRSLDGEALEFSADCRRAFPPLTISTTKRYPNVTVRRRAAGG